MHSAGIVIVTNSEDEFIAIHHAVGKAHDRAAPPSVVRRGRSVDGMEQDHAGAGEEEVLCLSYHGQGDTAGELTLTGGRWLWWTLLISLMWATLSCFR